MATSHESSGNSSRSRSDQQCQVIWYHDEIAPLRGEIQWSNLWKEVLWMLLLAYTEIAELEMEKGFLEDKIKRLKETKLKLDDVVEE
ncbi:Protein MLP1-like protein, partial [Bienertia sinuspersici]